MSSDVGFVARWSCACAGISLSELGTRVAELTGRPLSVRQLVLIIWRAARDEGRTTKGLHPRPLWNVTQRITTGGRPPA